MLKRKYKRCLQTRGDRGWERVCGPGDWGLMEQKVTIVLGGWWVLKALGWRIVICRRVSLFSRGDFALGGATGWTRAIWKQPKYPQKGTGSVGCGALIQRGSVLRGEHCHGGVFNGTEICLLFIVKWKSVFKLREEWVWSLFVKDALFRGKICRFFFLILSELKKLVKSRKKRDVFSVVIRDTERSNDPNKVYLWGPGVRLRVQSQSCTYLNGSPGKVCSYPLLTHHCVLCKVV